MSLSDKNLLLVSLIEKYPCIYNHNLQDYMKKDITEKAWGEVSLQTSLTVAECKEKWRNLRYSLLRSLKPNPDGTLKKKYYLHKEMEFLIPFMRTKAAGFLKFDEEIDEDSHESNQDVMVASPQQQLVEYEFLDTEPSNKRKRSMEHFQARSQLHCDHPHYRKQFMLGIMPEVYALSEEQMKAFRRKVLALLDEITEGSDSVKTRYEVKSEPVDEDGVYTIT